jgi:hypothetical protein
VVWANLHAGVFVAPLLLAFAAGGAALDRDRAWRWLATGSLLALAATLATPLGFGLFRYLRLHVTIPAVHTIDEFRGPTWISDAPLFVYGAALLAVLGGAAVAARWRPRWTQLAPLLALALLVVRSVRFAPELALVAAPLLASAATTLADRLRLRVPTLLAGPVPVVFTVALLAGFTIVPRLGATATAGIGLDRREIPEAAIAFVEANDLRDRMYNDFEVGSYLLFDPKGGYPRHQVFVDPRLPAYPFEFHQLLGRFDLSRDEWSAAMDRYGVETALLAYAGLNRRVAWWDPERWALVYRAGDARVFVRRLPRYRALIAAREIPATFSFTIEEGVRTWPLERRPADSPVPDCEWQRRLGDLRFELDGTASPAALAAYGRALEAPPGCLEPAEDARLSAWLGALALGAGHAADALPLFDRALAHGARDVTTLSNRALALEGLGRNADAAAAWAEVAQKAAGTPLGRKAEERRSHLQAAP